MYLEPLLQALELGNGPSGASINSCWAEAGFIVSEPDQSLAHCILRQLLTPPLAGPPVPVLVVPVHLYGPDTLRLLLATSWLPSSILGMTDICAGPHKLPSSRDSLNSIKLELREHGNSV